MEEDEQEIEESKSNVAEKSEEDSEFELNWKGGKKTMKKSKAIQKPLKIIGNKLKTIKVE